MTLALESSREYFQMLQPLCQKVCITLTRFDDCWHREPAAQSLRSRRSQPIATNRPDGLTT